MMLSSTLYLAWLALIAPAIFVSAKPSLFLSVSGSKYVDGIENLKLTASIKNNGNESLKILNEPTSPLSKLPTDIFSIKGQTGHKPLFAGAKAKYVSKVAVALGAYTLLKPGEEILITHTIGDAYDFTETGEGSYIFEARNLFHIIDDSQNIIPIYAQTSSHSARVSGNLKASAHSKKSSPSPSPSSKQKMRTKTKSNHDDEDDDDNENNSDELSRRAYNGCSESQQTTLAAAASAAQSYATAAASYATSISTGTTRYTTWFGAYTTSRHNTIVTHFNLIDTSDIESFDFDCTCTQTDSYAYVYANGFGTIYICPAFWSAPATGTDSQAGTLIHETSHFNINGGTNDYAYGQTACQSLAISSPITAIDNADSHEYFAENVPALS